MEEVIILLAQDATKMYADKTENLVLAGGVALNCVANGILQQKKLFKRIWIQPAAGDAGGALGCALYAYYEFFKKGVLFQGAPVLDHLAYRHIHNCCIRFHSLYAQVLF